MEKTQVGILLFDGVEVLDFAGPYEVFSRTRLVPGSASRRSEDSAPFNAFTIAKQARHVVATGGLKVIPDFEFATTPAIDLLVVPGGFGTRQLLDDVATIEWIQKVAGQATWVTSVCTGALLLARAKLLTHRSATTHWAALDLLQSLDSTIAVQGASRYVNDGVITSAGVSAGIDMAFAVVELIHGKAVADETAQYIEFKRSL